MTEVDTFKHMPCRRIGVRRNYLRTCLDIILVHLSHFVRIRLRRQAAPDVGIQRHAASSNLGEGVCAVRACVYLEYTEDIHI